MSTMTVGAGEQYSTIAGAVAASSSGDTINVDAGTYANDVLNISHSLTLQAVGGTVKLVGTAQPANQKGLIDEGGAGVNVSITGFDISGATVPDANGAGVRYEGGNLTLDNVTVHDNQNGILANADANGSITIANSTFANNGIGDGQTHNIYVGAVGSLTVQGSTITSAQVGHDIKSRAASTTITGNSITDGPTGTASYEIDLPNGGMGDIEGNTIEKGANAQNPIAITTGEEGNAYANSSLTVEGNTIVSEYAAHSSTAVVNKTGGTAIVSGNQLYGWTTVASGSASVSNNITLATEPSLGGPAGGNAPISPGTVMTPSTPSSFMDSGAAASPQQNAGSPATADMPNAVAATPNSAAVVPSTPAPAAMSWVDGAGQANGTAHRHHWSGQEQAAIHSASSMVGALTPAQG